MADSSVDDEDEDPSLEVVAIWNVHPVPASIPHVRLCARVCSGLPFHSEKIDATVILAQFQAGSETGADETPVKVRSTAEKLANWNGGETKTTKAEGTATSVWSKLQLQNGSGEYQGEKSFSFFLVLTPCGQSDERSRLNKRSICHPYSPINKSILSTKKYRI